MKVCIILLITASLHAANWSDPLTWGGVVPTVGSSVVINHGQSVVLDTDIDITSLELHGRLEVARRDTTISAGFLMLHGGELIAGTQADPFTNKLTITLTGTDRAAIPGMGGRAIAVMGGGRLELIGATTPVSWTMLAHGFTANVGATTITLESATGWSVGDQIIITSTDFDYAQTEKRTITSISGNVVMLDAPLAYLHYGVITTVGHGVDGVPTTIDERAEVGLLSRNIKIRGSADSEIDGYGGHIMIMDDASVALEEPEGPEELAIMGAPGAMQAHRRMAASVAAALAAHTGQAEQERLIIRPAILLVAAAAAPIPAVLA